MEVVSMTSLPRLAPPHYHHCDRQDAREGGETPPLPRNCERTFCPRRRISRRWQLGFSPVLPLQRGIHFRPLESNQLRLWEGGWIKRKSGDRSSAHRETPEGAFRSSYRQVDATPTSGDLATNSEEHGSVVSRHL